MPISLDQKMICLVAKTLKNSFFFGKKCTIIWYMFIYYIICIYPEMKIKTVFLALKS